jgi:hypothetical protein
MRSKIPVFSLSGNHNDEAILLSSFGNDSTKSNYNTNEAENNNATNNEEYQNYKPRVIDGLDRDYSDNDLFEYSERACSHKINEWQAAWNVTNAIQVEYKHLYYIILNYFCIHFFSSGHVCC